LEIIMKKMRFNGCRADAIVLSTGVGIEQPSRSRRPSAQFASAMAQIVGVASNGLILTIVLVSLIVNQTIILLQASKGADHMAVLKQASDSALAALDEEKKPESPDRTRRLKILNQKMFEQVQQLQREFD